MQNEDLLQKNFYGKYKITKISKILRREKNFHPSDENGNISDSNDGNDDLSPNHIHSNSNSENNYGYINNIEDFPIIYQNSLTPERNNIFQTEIQEDCYERKNCDENINIIDNSKEATKKIKNHRSLEINAKHLKKKENSNLSKNLKIYLEIQDICNHFYNDNNQGYKKSVQDEMVIKESEFVKKYAHQFLSPKKGINDIDGYDILREETTKETIKDIFKNNKNINSIKKSEVINTDQNSKLEELIQKILQNNDEILNTINNENISRYRFEHFGGKRNMPRHPRLIYLRNKQPDEKLELPPIRRTHIELSEMLPNKKRIVAKRKNYSVFKKIQANQREDFIV